MVWSGALADGLLFFILIQMGWNLGTAQIASFLAGLAVTGWFLWRRGAAVPAGVRRAVAVGHWLVVCLLTVFLRDGVLTLWADHWKFAPSTGILPAVAASALALWQGRVTLPLYSPEIGREKRWLSLGMRLMIYVFALRLLYLGLTELLPEEAYYWNYSKHLDIGYLDHPPMVAWLIRLGTGLFGDCEFGVRIGALGCWLAAAGFSFRLARDLFDRVTGRVALWLLLVPPFFFSAGFLMTPDAPLTAAWAGALFYLQRALLLHRSRAWLGVGICIGLGMLSKYSIALLGPAALVFMLMDRPSRRWLTRWEPYLSGLVALAIFSPVILWNAQNGWVSFAFQTTKRLAAKPSFSLHELIGSALLLLTPVGLYAAVRVFFPPGGNDPGKRPALFMRVFVALPLLVFCLFSLRHQVKLEWTGPLWLAAIPGIAYGIRSFHLNPLAGAGSFTRTAWVVTMVGMTIFYGTVFHYLTMGLPGVGYCRQMQVIPVGWRDLGRQIDFIEDGLEASTGEEPIIVGMDRNFIASQLAFYDPDREESVETISGPHLFGKNSLMYERWFPPKLQKNRTLLMVAWNSRDLEGRRIASRVRRLDAIKEGVVTRNGKFVSRFYYRFAFGYSWMPIMKR